MQLAPPSTYTPSNPPLKDLYEPTLWLTLAHGASVAAVVSLLVPGTRGGSWTYATLAAVVVTLGAATFHNAAPTAAKRAASAIPTLALFVLVGAVLYPLFDPVNTSSWWALLVPAVSAIPAAVFVATGRNEDDQAGAAGLGAVLATGISVAGSLVVGVL